MQGSLVHDALYQLMRERVPARQFRYIPMAVSSGKIKYVMINGTTLKWRRGKIFSISLSTQQQEI